MLQMEEKALCSEERLATQHRVIVYWMLFVAFRTNFQSLMKHLSYSREQVGAKRQLHAYSITHK